MQKKLMPIGITTGPKSISDDDLCARCSHCAYKPGEQSDCTKGWPGLVDADGYVQECGTFAEPETILAQQFSCYVLVTGEATDDEDEGVQGVHQIEVKLSAPVALTALSEADETVIAKAVLDEFHNRQGIEELDAFEITPYLETGRTICEEDIPPPTDISASATYHGMVGLIDELPEVLAAYQPTSLTH